MRNLLITLIAVTALLNSTKSLAVAIADGEYNLIINTTPLLVPDIPNLGVSGSDGNYNTLLVSACRT